VEYDGEVSNLGEANQSFLEVEPPDLGVELFEADGVDARPLERRLASLLLKEVAPSLVETVEHDSADMAREIVDPVVLGAEVGEIAALLGRGVELLGVAEGAIQSAQALLVGEVPEEAAGPLPALEALKLGLGRVDPEGEDGVEGHAMRKEVTREKGKGKGEDRSNLSDAWWTPP